MNSARPSKYLQKLRGKEQAVFVGHVLDDTLQPSTSAPNLQSFVEEASTPLLTSPSGSRSLQLKRQSPEEVTNCLDVESQERRLDSPEPLRPRPRLSTSCVVGGVSACWHRIGDVLPILRWLPQYDWRKDLKGDVFGGIIIGVVLVCQTMAHAAIATTQPVQGPYCALAPAVTYAMLGTTRHASISSGAVAAMLIAEQLEVYHGIEMRTHMASLLALLVGIILAILGICRAAFVVRFMSQPCLSGFVSAASLVIVASQLKHFFGISEHVPSVNGFFQNVWVLLIYASDINVISIAIGLFCIFGIQTMKMFKIKHKSTGQYKVIVFLCSFKEILVVVVSTSLVAATAGNTSLILTHDGKLSRVGALVPCIGTVPEGLPEFRVPWDPSVVPDDIHRHVLQLLTPAGVIALTTYLTTYASSQRVATQQGYQIQPNQEAIALGFAGIVGSFFGAFPPSGSLSRASLLPQVGVQTQVGGLVAALIVGLSLSYLASGFYYMPRAALSGIIIFASYGLQDFKYLFWLLKHSRMWGKPRSHERCEYQRSGGLYKDVCVWVCAFAVTLLCGVVDGICAAVGFSFFLLIKSAIKPAVLVMGRVQQFNMWRDVRYWDCAIRYPGVLVIAVRAPLFFGNAEFVREKIQMIIDKQEVPVEYVVFDAGAVHSIDATALSTLKDMMFSWKAKGVNCIVSNANGQVRGLLHTHMNDMHQVTFYLTTEDAVTIARKLLARRLDHGRQEARFNETEAVVKIQRALRMSRASRIRHHSCHNLSRLEK